MYLNKKLMYYRLYPSKNNTIFEQFVPGTSSVLPWSLSVNTGNSPVMQLMDGSANSMMVFGFTFPSWLVAKLNSYSYNCNFKIYDAGTIYDSVLPLKEIQLRYFNSDFSEGDGWFFEQANSLQGISNWNNNLSDSLWSSVTFSMASTMYLNKNNQDLSFDVTSMLAENISIPNTPFGLALNVVSPQTDMNILSKFLWGRHTKTVFKPYIEFFIQDDIVDDSYDTVAGQANNIYFINENGIDFNGAVSAQVTLNNNVVSTNEVSNLGNGIYTTSITPVEPASFSVKEYVVIVWMINSNPVYKQIIEVAPQNMFISKTDYKNLMFYPITPYTNSIIRHGDVVPFQVVSQIRGEGDIITNTFRYKVISAAGFEMTPWMPVSLYKNKMFFFVDTSYFFPENVYEVFIQNVSSGFQITSNTTYKFKLVSNEASHLRELSASPYYSRQSFFEK